MEGRLTLCNMSIEAGARTGMVAPDETTFAYVKGRPFAPKGADVRSRRRGLAAAAERSRREFDREVSLDASAIAPVVTWGTSPEDTLPIDGARARSGAGDAIRRARSRCRARSTTWGSRRGRS